MHCHRKAEQNPSLGINFIMESSIQPKSLPKYCGESEMTSEALEYLHLDLHLVQKYTHPLSNEEILDMPSLASLTQPGTI